MKVSIITVTYNSEKTIQDTLESVNKQSYENIEHIVIDGNSKDETIDIVRSKGNRVATLISEEDQGIYDALNKGISIACGDVIGFLHSDDMFASDDSIKEIVKTFTNSKCSAVYGDLEYVSRTDTKKIIRYWKAGDFTKNKIIWGWMPPHPTFYMKRELYTSLGGFDTNFKISADYESLLRYLWLNEIKPEYLPRVLVAMRVGGVSNRSLKDIYLKSKEDKRALQASNLPWLFTLLAKNISKVSQYWVRDRSKLFE